MVAQFLKQHTDRYDAQSTKHHKKKEFRKYFLRAVEGFN